MPKTEYKEVQIGPRKIDIPVEWETSLLKDVADIVSGSTPKKSQEEYWEGDIVWITPTDITENDSKYISDSEEKITQEGLESCSTHILEPGAVLMTSRATIGEASINTVEACTNQGFKSIVCGEELHNEYFYYYLPMIKDYLNAIGGGSTFPEINKTDTETIKLPLPPLPEQRRIAEILSTVDEAIQQTDEIIETSKELKKGLMQDLLTKGIGHDEFKEVQLGPKDIDIPKDWKMEKLGDMASLKNGINFSKDQKGDKGLPTVDVLNMYGPGTDIDTSELYRVDKDVKDKYLLQKGDILFVRSSLKQGGIGWASKFNGSDEPMTFCGFLIRARLDAEKINTDFLVYYLRDDLVRDILIAGSGKVANTNISQSDIGRLKVPVPPLDEQREIAERLSVVDEKIRQEEEYREELEELKKGLMQDLLTGEVRVSLDG